MFILGYLLMFLGISFFITSMISQNFLTVTTSKTSARTITLHIGMIAGCWNLFYGNTYCVKELGYMVQGEIKKD